MKKETLELSDFDNCLKLFSQPFPQILERCASNLHTLRHTQGPMQHLELLTVLFDLAGAECVKEVTKIECVHKDLNSALTNVILPK
ncbi:orf30 [Alcelaphine gammaherpesvirus 2]|uniref:Orf30 n=1 Tax=Alcelaphine gammaherpesvirus 2 TaxID=138184 RepID=A0A068AAK4_9GAMA|nr:orf30 [Alcelaphine gammaherpesvirus 2]AIA62066.1 orf30 [Alcelaphine gammaherpesvirus 2]